VRLTRPAVAAAAVLTFVGACATGQRPTVGEPLASVAPTTHPPGNDTATTQPAHPSGDPWADAIDIAPDADPCALLTEVVVTAVLGTADHGAAHRDGERCSLDDGDHELTVEIVGHGDLSRDQANSRYQDSKPALSLDAVNRSPASILYSRAPGEGTTAVFLDSSAVHFAYTELQDPQAFFDALVVAMRRPDAS
jgi:hypothetical protein